MDREIDWEDRDIDIYSVWDIECKKIDNDITDSEITDSDRIKS